MQSPFILNYKKLIAISTLTACLSAGLLVINAEGSARTNPVAQGGTPTGTPAALAEQCRQEDNNKDFEKALADCTAAIKGDPNYADAYYYRGLVYYDTFEADKA